MRLAFVSDVSPHKVGVYGIRISRFAQAMAARGHQVVVLYPAQEEAPPTSLPGLPADIQTHDWRMPLDVAYRPAPSRLLDLVHKDQLPAVLRKPLTAALFASQGGVHGNYVAAARPYVAALATQFRPDLVWGNFGNASNLVMSQQLAHAARAPWLMDLKDNWDGYLRPGVREMLARRFGDATGFTSNARFHAVIAARYHRQPYRVIYSSISPEMMAPAGVRADRTVFRIMLVGSVYDRDRLARFLDGLRSWHGSLPQAGARLVRFHYAGVGAADVGSLIAESPLGCPATVEHNIHQSQLGPLCQGAGVNCYISPGVTFHHKLLELLACRRPILAFPREHEESVELARRVNGLLLVCADSAAVSASLATIFDRWQRGDETENTVDVSSVSWDAGAAQLEEFFQAALDRRLRGSANPARPLAHNLG